MLKRMLQASTIAFAVSVAPSCHPRHREGKAHGLNLGLSSSLSGSRTGTNLKKGDASMGALDRPNQGSELKFVVTNTLIVRDIARSVAFYRDVLGATVLREGEPTFLRLANIWLTINLGGEPTDDKPEVIASPPRDQNTLSVFLNLRVTDIKRCYELWSSRSAKFITEPKVHATELRCYIRDPDGYLIEVGQTTMTPGPLDLYV
jgi:lactoylglutathione lyase